MISPPIRGGGVGAAAGMAAVSGAPIRPQVGPQAGPQLKMSPLMASMGSNAGAGAACSGPMAPGSMHQMGPAPGQIRKIETTFKGSHGAPGMGKPLMPLDAMQPIPAPVSAPLPAMPAAMIGGPQLSTEDWTNTVLEKSLLDSFSLDNSSTDNSSTALSRDNSSSMCITLCKGDDNDSEVDVSGLSLDFLA